MRVHVAFTPAEADRAPVAVVVDVLRATSTIAQALASGYRRVLCCAEIEEARAVRAALEEGVLAGERRAEAIPGFDLGNSPADSSATGRDARDDDDERDARDRRRGRQRGARARRKPHSTWTPSRRLPRAGGDAEVVCAGVEGRFTIDDAYCAGRIAELLGGERSDAAEAAVRLARSSAAPMMRCVRPRTRAGSHLDDIAWCARESVLDVAPKLVRMEGPAAEIVAA